MHARRVVSGLTLISFGFLSACKDSKITTTAPLTNATVRFVNATTTSMDIAQGGTVADGNGGIPYGTSGTCTTVNAANPNLTVDQAGTTTAISGFTPNFVPGGNYTVIAYPGATGTTQFATLDNTGFKPASGDAGLRVFNAASGSTGVDAFVGTATTASATGVTFGNGSAFFSVPAGSQAVNLNNAGTTTSVLTTSNQTFAAGQTSILVVAPPAAGTTALQYIMVSGC